MKLVLEELCNPRYHTEIETLFSIDDAFQTATRWVQEDGELSIAGSEDEITKARTVHFYFYKGQDEVASASASMEQILSKHPFIADFIPPRFRPLDMDFASTFTTDDQYFDWQEATMEAHWSEDLQGHVTSLRAAIDFAVGHALSGHGESDLRKISPISVADLSGDPACYLEHFLEVFHRLCNAKRTGFEAGSFHVDLRRAAPRYGFTGR